ncbi:MAG: CDP-diacylglycerol--serine O-phosphatidyltransferase [Candidatus Omnitrophica bacterium]|nr:CDP-diacylglycerol--serine O-phosphatidyltransferase [Candidatus Omnitrophota bacterium]MBI5144801.1 CDP-diacylglycerol--serine O-phosphatidyltransferase [Candidatus Omnitrophota bacterium]
MAANFLANLLTVLSLVCGFISIIFSLESHFTFASWAIILAVVFDGLDGQVARRNPIPSEFGKQLDSLVDAVSFGIAPAILGYVFVYRDFYLWATLILFIYLVSSVMRLAKYNITPKEAMAKYFYGLPTTVSGGILVSFILIYRKKGLVALPQYVPVIFILMVLALACLMLSRIRYLNLDGLKEVLGKNKIITVLLLAVFLVVAAFLKKVGVAVLLLFLIYLVFSPFFARKIV